MSRRLQSPVLSHVRSNLDLTSVLSTHAHAPRMRKLVAQPSPFPATTRSTHSIPVPEIRLSQSRKLLVQPAMSVSLQQQGRFALLLSVSAVMTSHIVVRLSQPHVTFRGTRCTSVPKDNSRYPSRTVVLELVLPMLLLERRRLLLWRRTDVLTNARARRPTFL
jgi:hypothetical protein